MHSIRAPGSQNCVPPKHCFAVMLAPSPGISAAFGSERLQTFDATTGMIIVNPAGPESKAIWSTRLENIVVTISPEDMMDLAEEEPDRVNLDLKPTKGVVDPTALHFAKLMKLELSQPFHSNELYLDSLITAFGIHILRNYSNIAKPQRNARAGLSMAAANRVREYVDEHFRRKLTIAELAPICGLSPGHFAQSFTKTFGISPHRYVLDRRLAFAEDLLRENKLSISEVAFLSGFSSQSHLTHIMRLHQGRTPNQLRAT